MAQARSETMSREAGAGSETLRAIEAARAFVASRSSVRPEVGIVLGTGLGRFAEAMTGADSIPFSEIPGFPTPSTASIVARRRSLGGVGALGLPAVRARLKLRRSWGTATRRRFEQALARLAGTRGGAGVR